MLRTLFSRLYKENLSFFTNHMQCSFLTNDVNTMEISELVQRISDQKFKERDLNNLLHDPERVVEVRRQVLEEKIKIHDVNNYPMKQKCINGIHKLPFRSYPYQDIVNRCCDNPIGYITVPVGVVGPYKINNQHRFIPLATTEGGLLASIQRGTKAITVCGGATTHLYKDGITRAPLLKFKSVTQALNFFKWIEQQTNLLQIETVFNNTSHYAKLKSIKPLIVGKNIYLRFVSETGNAMGMNMISKAVEYVMEKLIMPNFAQDIQSYSISGNVCTDKKSTHINWLEGRGKSLICEAKITREVVEKILKTNIDDLVQLNIDKNLIGSSIAGGMAGSFNAHSANIVAAIFLATGQDIAQIPESANCMTLLESVDNGSAIHITCTMPSIEVATVGGGTHLGPQKACLNIMGVDQNVHDLARIIIATVMAGELNLLSALTSGDLVKAHMQLNRKQ